MTIGQRRIQCSEAATMLGVSPRMVQKLCQEGEIPGAKMQDRIWTMSEDGIARFLRICEKRTKAEQKVHCAKQEASYRAKRVAEAEDRMVATDVILQCASSWPKTGCGIYFLIQTGRIVYVGQARNVVARVAQHAAEKKFDAWAWVPCRKERLSSLERAYIDALMPPLNRDTLTVRRRAVLEEAQGDRATDPTLARADGVERLGRSEQSP